MKQLAIEGRDLTKTYGTGAVAYQALRGVDFVAEQGEFVMLSGPSGSGKTTLLSIMGCVLSATSGSLRLFGKEVTSQHESTLPALRLGYIGFIFQGHNLVSALSAQDNIVLILKMRGWSESSAKQEAMRLLERVGLADKAKSFPEALSGGQRQRVAIARAVAGAPPLLLADEPTASLDAPSGLSVTELLRDMAHESGHTVVTVTHDNRIYHLADRIVKIEDGKILKEGSHEA